MRCGAAACQHAFALTMRQPQDVRLLHCCRCLAHVYAGCRTPPYILLLLLLLLLVLGSSVTGASQKRLFGSCRMLPCQHCQGSPQPHNGQAQAAASTAAVAAAAG